MTTPRIFTVAEAERTLPLVRRIVGDLMLTYPLWREAMARYEVLTGPVRADQGETAEVLEAQAAATALAARIHGYLQELEQIGCVFKGFDAGLVDFYALRDDRLVFLCWKLGEERITHWHDVDSGFAGRQPIDAAMLTETRA